jgi:hypothetical protein
VPCGRSPAGRPGSSRIAPNGTATPVADLAAFEEKRELVAVLPDEPVPVALYIAQIDGATFFAIEGFVPPQGGSVHRCNVATGSCTTVIADVPILTSITFRSSGSLWGAINAVIPGGG